MKGYFQFDVNHPRIIRLRIMINRLLWITQDWHWDAIFPLLASILSMLCVLKTGGSEKDKISRTIMIGTDGYDVTRWTIWVVVVLGLTLFVVGLKRLLGRGTQSFNKYLGILISVIIGHFCVGLVITEYKSHITDILAETMSAQVEEIRYSQSKFGMTFKLAEIWDYMQIQMKCCGAESYRDYGNDKEMLPRSCCVLKTDRSSDLIQTENWYQCRHDFVRGVHDSVFLHTTGCHEPLYSWFLRYTAAITGLLFGSISLQAVSILYLSWQGFMKAQNTPGVEIT